MPLFLAVFFSVSIGASADGIGAQDDFGSWVERESLIAAGRMAANISAPGTARGVVLASPSRRDPNYYYYWVRDGAMVMRSVLALYEAHQPLGLAGPLNMLVDYVRFSRDNQIKAFGQLGEPRFNADGSLNTEPWGRPQNDGPALRALTMIRFAHDLMASGNLNFVTSELYSPRLPAETVIKADLEFIAHHWREKCIDLWEEIWGLHFFTRATQLAALREGAKLAALLNDPNASAFYSQEADSLEKELTQHWDPQSGYYISTLEQSSGPEHAKPTQLDTSVILAALAAEQSSGPLSVTDSRILATALHIEETFMKLYPINRNSNYGAAIGRYPEDKYFGGNPWVLTTAAFAELNDRLAVAVATATSFPMTQTHADYFMRVLRLNGTPQTVLAGSDLVLEPALRDLIVRALVAKAETYLLRIRLHTNSDGSLSEQFRADSGHMLSAVDLSWSYASFLRAADARQQAFSVLK